MITNFRLFEMDNSFTSGNFEFEYESDRKEGDKIVVKGTLKYHGENYDGDFTYYPDGQSYWNFFTKDGLELEPESDDFYELDSLMQEVEANFVN